MNSPWSNIKLEGQMNSKFDEIAIHEKAEEKRNPLKPESSDFEL